VREPCTPGKHARPVRCARHGRGDAEAGNYGELHCRPRSDHRGDHRRHGDLPTAKVLLDAVERRRKTTETVDQGAQIAELEKAAAQVDFGRCS
jgi:hypothetical protein